VQSEKDTNGKAELISRLGVAVFKSATVSEGPTVNKLKIAENEYN
jgi:hypothetical protein